MLKSSRLLGTALKPSTKLFMSQKTCHLARGLHKDMWQDLLYCKVSHNNNQDKLALLKNQGKQVSLVSFGKPYLANQDMEKFLTAL